MRVSTVKKYDNKDVIKQIFDLNARTGAMETSLAPLTEAVSQGIASSQQLDAETSARIVGDALLRSGVDAAVNGVLIEGTDTSMTVTVEKNTGPPLSTPLPVASPSVAGVMNAETFNSIVTMQNRVTALENRQLMYTVTLPTEHPTQSEVTTAYTTTYPTAPNPPLTGTVVADLPKNFQCTWDGNKNIWVKTVVGVGQATNDTLGIVKGANSPGKAFVETDGTMSVVGWDGLGARVTACEDTDTTQNASISSLGNRVTALEAGGAGSWCFNLYNLQSIGSSYLIGSYYGPNYVDITNGYTDNTITVAPFDLINPSDTRYSTLVVDPADGYRLKAPLTPDTTYQVDRTITTNTCFVRCDPKTAIMNNINYNLKQVLKYASNPMGKWIGTINWSVRSMEDTDSPASFTCVTTLSQAGISTGLLTSQNGWVVYKSGTTTNMNNVSVSVRYLTVVTSIDVVWTPN